MSFLLTITDFSTAEGIYTAEQLAVLAPRLGYRDLVIWDRGLHGYPKLRQELAFARAPVRLHVGCRFTWRGQAFGALPCSAEGYAALNRLLTAQAHEAASSSGISGLGSAEPPWGCILLAERLEGLELLAREGVAAQDSPVALLAHHRRQREAAEALARGLSVAGPQVLRFRTPAGLELHRLKRAIHTQSTVARTEPLWDLSDAAVDRRTWEARFPWAEPRIARTTEAMLERISAWSIHWAGWVNAEPLGLEGSDLDAELRERVRAGILKRYGAMNGEREGRMEQELDLIQRKQFAAYFLLVHDIIAHAPRPENGAKTCGRGSGAASLVSYALELTNVDPIATNLVFERFLTEARKDPPDLDIDFAWDERDDVIQSVFERYGRTRVAMVANHCFFKRKSALRAVAMAHGRPESELKSLAQFIRGWDGGRERIQDNPHWAPILAQSDALKGHFSQFSVHPGGTVIAPGPLWEHVAFQPAPAKENVSITCWDKDGIEGYGLVKLDLLGNRSLAVIRDARQVLGERVPVDLGTESRQDPATQKLLAEGDSIGVFYVESPATRQLQKRIRKGDFETLVIHSSLIRPAAYHWVETYVRRSRAEEHYVATHPVFMNLLSESHGVLIYQEDVVRVVMELAGWNHEEADALRKLLGKDDCARKLPNFEAQFREGCTARGIPPYVMDEAWGMIRTFQGYSFCKPHSASYAQVSFESAWLKAHHPAVFFASVITNQGGYYPAIAYLGDARRHRLTVRGPDANGSSWAFTAEGEQALRVGLLQIRGAHEDEIHKLLEERERNGPFTDLDELLRRVSLSIPTVEALASAGAFDLWAPGGDRTRLLWTRLGGVPPGVRPRPTDPFDRAELELQTMNLTLEIHPATLARVRHGNGPHRAADVLMDPGPDLRGPGKKAGRFVRFWALVVAEKRVQTEKGEAMQFISFEDETALCEAVAFPDAFKRRKRPYLVGDVVPVAGRSMRQDGLAVLEVA